MQDSIASHSPLAQLHGLFRLMRPKQWIKNGFVAAPLIFSGEFLNVHAIEHTLLTFFLFCLASASTYIINDIHDIELDRTHPKKSKSRPLAAGIVSIPMAWSLFTIINGILCLSWFLAPQIMLVITAYLALTLAYTFKLKELPIVDLFTIAIGFVLRVYAGAVAVAVPVSSWMFITTLCLALYLAVLKRRQEHTQYGATSRKVLKKYSLPLLNDYAQMSATGALTFYSMYVMSNKPQLVITIPLVLFGLFRYGYLVDQRDNGESPTDVLLTDWPLLLTLLLWVCACSWLLFSTTLGPA